MSTTRVPMWATNRMYCFYRMISPTLGPLIADPNAYNQETRCAFGSQNVVRNSTPDWQKRIADGRDASNYYSRNGVSIRMGRTSVEALIKVGETHYNSVGGNITLGLTHLIQNNDPDLRDLALKRFKARLARNTGESQLGAPIAELHEVRSLITSLQKESVDLLLALIRIRKTKGASAWKYASEKWLTYQFGIAPLVRDIKTGLASIEKYFVQNDRRVRLYAGASKYWTEVVPNRTKGPYGTWFNSDATYQHKLSYRYIGAWDLIVDSANDYSLHEHLGVTFGALPSVAWELTPFSWVVDYVCTMGEFLEDAFSSPPGDLKYFVLCRKYDMKVLNRMYYTPKEGSIIRQQKGEGICEYWEFERTPLTALPHRPLRFRTAAEIRSNLTSKLMNLASVLGAGNTIGMPARRGKPLGFWL